MCHDGWAVLTASRSPLLDLAGGGVGRTFDHVIVIEEQFVAWALGVLVDRWTNRRTCDPLCQHQDEKDEICTVTLAVWTNHVEGVVNGVE